MQGTAYWAKIVGQPVKAYNAGEFEWSMDFTIDEKNLERAKTEGWSGTIKNKGDDRGDFITFRRKSIKKDGTPSKPINIVDGDRMPWDGRKIGNGSKVYIQYVVNDRPKGKIASLIAVQIIDLVPYEGVNAEDFEDFPVVDANGVESWD